MREYLNADDHANAVRMLRLAHRGVLCVVEGDTDRRLYGEFFGTNLVRFVCCGPMVAAVLERINKTATAGVVGIMDADFCRLDGDCPTLDNLFLTDFHDLEVGLVFSNAFVRVIGELGSDEKLSRALRNGSHDILRDTMLSAAAPIGALRWLNRLKSLGLNFDGLPFDRFIDFTSLEVNRDSAYNAVCQRSAKPHLINAIRAEANGILVGPADKKQLCCGHDLVEVMGCALRKLWGTRAAGDVSPEKLSRMLRLAYGMVDFSATLLYKAVRAWEHNNPDYRLLRADGCP